MPSSRRSLTVEPFEDRALPSVSYVVVVGGFADQVQKADGPGRRPGSEFAEWNRPYLTADGFAIPLRGTFEARFYDRFPESDDHGNDDAGGPSIGSAASDGAGKGAGRIATRLRADALTGGTDAVSLAPPSQSAAAAPADPRTAAQVLPNPTRVAGNQPFAPVAAPLFADRVGVVSTALVISPGDGPPSADAPDPAPPSAADPLPSAPIETLPAEDTSIEVPAAVAVPVAGLVPIDLSGIGAAAGNFLGRLSALEVTWPAAMPGFEDYLWTAAAALLAAGAVHASRPGRRADPPRAKTRLDPALAEWEDRHAG